MARNPKDIRQKLEAQLSAASSKAEKLRLCLEFLEGLSPSDGADVVWAAKRARDLAEALNDAHAGGRARYHGGLGHLALARSVRDAVDTTEAGEEDLELAITDLKQAYSTFSELRANEATEAGPPKPADRRSKVNGESRLRGRVAEKPNELIPPEDAAAAAALALGLAYIRKEMPAEALRWQNVAMVTCTLAALRYDPNAPPNPMLARAHEAMGTTYLSIGEYARASEQFEESLAIRQELNDPLGTAASFAALASAFQGLGNFDTALDLFEQGRALYRKHGNRFKEAVVLTQIACVHMDHHDEKTRTIEAEQAGEREPANDEGFPRRRRTKGKPMNATAEPEPGGNGRNPGARRGRTNPASVEKLLTSALDCGLRSHAALQLVLERLDDEDLPADVGDVHERLAEAKLLLGRIDAARADTTAALIRYSEAYELLSAHASPRALLPILLHAGRAHRRRDEFGKSTDTFDHAIAIARSVGDRRLEYQFHAELSAMFEERGHWRDAFVHHKEYARIRDEVAGERARLTAEVQRIAMETDLRQREADRLSVLNAQQEADLARLHKKLGVEKGATGGSRLSTEWPFYLRLLEDRHPGFLDRLKGRFPKLTPAERRVCGMIRLGYDSADIKWVLSLDRGLEAHRHNIRVKMGLNLGKTRLEEFIEAI